MAWPQHTPEKISEFISEYCRKNNYQLKLLEPWREGASHAIWKFDFDDSKTVFKIGKLDYWRKLGTEAKILRECSGAGTPVLLDNGEASPDFPWDWAILERIEGEHPFVLSADEAEEIGAMLSGIRKRVSPENLDNGDWRSFAEKRITPSLELAMPAVPEGLKNRFDAILSMVEQCSEIGRKLDAQPLGIVHGDFTPLNLLKKSSGGYALLDWEHPRNGGIAWDIANIRKAFRLDKDQLESLILGTGEKIDDELLTFAGALYELHVAAWRTEMWFGRKERDYGDFFLIELGEELGRVEMFLSLLV